MEHASHLTPENLLRHEAFVLRLARTLVRGDADAEEVAQRTLTSALENPPQHGGVRNWLAHVTRNHATDLHRSERRRSAREERAARPEAVAAGESALEQLELQNVVVRAVLALDEPYRGVVVATYYEGLTPKEIAERRGVPSGTVRSWLARAHEMLRAKLDRERGDRDGWMRGLTGLLALRAEDSAAAAATTVSGPPIAWPLVLGAGVVASVIGVLVLRVALAPADPAAESAVGPLSAATTGVSNARLDAEPAASARVAAADEGYEGAAATVAFMPADEPAKLLEQSRQIKQLILDRRLAVTADERARAGIPADTATSGVVRLLDRDAFGHAFSLPWMREGGSYYSFTERVHDFNRRPQISLQGGRLSSGLLVRLGERRLADVPASRVAPVGLDAAQSLLWELAWAEFDASRGHFASHVASQVNEAEAQGRIDAATARAARSPDARPLPGRAFLLRDVSSNDHDVIVALEVVAAGHGDCMLAYRVLESRPIPEPRTPFVPRDFATTLAPPSEALTRSSESDLRQALRAVRTRADEILFQRFTPAIEQRYGSWRSRPDAGIVRLLPYFSEWSELTADPVGGAHFEFLTRTHDGGGDVSLQGARGRGELGDGLTGGVFGVFADLGTTPIEDVSLAFVESTGEAGALLASHVFPHPTDLPAVEPARQAEIRAAVDRERAAGREFQRNARELGSSNRARAIVGRTFALRSVRFGSHDVLAAVHVVDEDDYGVVLAWKLLKSWPVQERD